MNCRALCSAVSQRRIGRASAWLTARKAAEEVLIVGASLDAANELARGLVVGRGAAFGWHRLTLPVLAAAVASPALALHGLVPLSRSGMEALVARLVLSWRERGSFGATRPLPQRRGFRWRSPAPSPSSVSPDWGPIGSPALPPTLRGWCAPMRPSWREPL
jgi:ATP-dependent helicase/nuclease subunit B